MSFSLLQDIDVIKNNHWKLWYYVKVLNECKFQQPEVILKKLEWKSKTLSS